MSPSPKKTRRRTCPVTGLQLHHIEDRWLTEDGGAIDLQKIAAHHEGGKKFAVALSTGKAVYGVPMIAGTIMGVDLRAAVWRCLPRVLDPTHHNSSYHLDQIYLGDPIEKYPRQRLLATLFYTLANSGFAGNENWARAWAATKNTSGLKRGRY